MCCQVDQITDVYRRIRSYSRATPRFGFSEPFSSSWGCFSRLVPSFQCHVSGFHPAQHQRSPQQEGQETYGRGERVAAQALCHSEEEDQRDL